VAVAVVAQTQIRAIDAGNAEGPGWGGVANDGATLFMRTVDPATISARNVEGEMVKAARLAHQVQVVQNIGSKTLLLIDHEQWGRSTVELDLPVTSEVWLEISFDDVGRAQVNMLNQSQLRAAVDAPPARLVGGGDCGNCDEAHGGPGCSDPVCEALVCSQDTFCCTVEWDQFCVNTALAKCDCGGGTDCAACPEQAIVNDAQVGISGTLFSQCGSGPWVSLAFPIQTGGADVDTVLSVHNTNTGEGDIYVMGGTCDGPDVNDILFTCCCGIMDAPSGVEISNSSGFPIATSDTDPTWVVMVFKVHFAFDVAYDSSTLGTSGAAYGNLSSLGDPGDWQDLDNYGFGACYFVDLALTGNPASVCNCGGPVPPPNAECADAEALDVAPGGQVCADGTTINASIDAFECETPTTAPGVWYEVAGTGNTMRATTCEDSPPAGADYDTKISVFCGECPEPSDCCSAHPPGNPGCDDPECEGIVCAQDPYCCNTNWDSLCADQALTKCEVCMGARELICVGGNDDACATSSLHSTVEWCSQAGAQYLILVHGFSSGVGNFTLCVEDDGIPCEPTVNCLGEEPTGACCQCDGPIQLCDIQTEEACAALEGLYLGEGEPCEAVGEELIYTATPGLVIPDGHPDGLSHTMTVDDSATILDLNVDLVITHTWVGDLCVTLRKDSGAEVTLINRMGDPDIDCDGGCCGCSADDFDIILDDEAAAPIEEQCAEGLTGSYIPEEPLSFFDGLTTDGDWTLFAHDIMGADIGTLVQWSLHFEIPDTGLTRCEEAYPNQCLSVGKLDIKPGSCPNSFNNKGTGNGKLPVALVGTDDIDVTEVDRR
jgi:subtilisin-like proprotein convertase family protein